MEPTELCKLAIKYRTDKTPFLNGDPDTAYPSHGYTPYYNELFLGKAVKRVLEVGIAGGGSLRMWEEFFKDAEIYGLDINRNWLVNEGRIKSFYCDQGNADSLRNAMTQTGGSFDLIVEDGSHEAAHQILTAVTLVPFLAPGGIYIIEDLCHPEEVVPHLPFAVEVKDFRLHRLSDDRIGVIRCQ